MENNVKKNNLTNWLQYLETLDPYKIQLGLARINTVAASLKLANFDCPVITVTGTNGKGSCVAFLEAIYKAAGYRVGAYTSPHLFRFNERIRINQQEVSDEVLVEAFTAIETARQDVPLTYFEFTTLAAFKIFQEASLDVVILEVGLGGRLDAVNLVDADVAVVTTVGVDHIDWLGPDRESIGREKAGIFRYGRFAVCGDPSPPQSMVDVAAALGCPFFIMKKDFSYQVTEKGWRWQAENRAVDLPQPKLCYQNAATALMAIDLLQARLTVSKLAISSGLKSAVLPGRFQKVGQCILDVAHNPHAATWLGKKLQEETHLGRTIAIVGMLKDKDISGTLAVLRDQIDSWYTADLPAPRGAQGALLLQILTQIGAKKCYNYPLISEAFVAAKRDCTERDRIVVFGSFHTVGLCLPLVLKGDKSGY